LKTFFASSDSNCRSRDQTIGKSEQRSEDSEEGVKLKFLGSQLEMVKAKASERKLSLPLPKASRSLLDSTADISLATLRPLAEHPVKSLITLSPAGQTRVQITLASSADGRLAIAQTAKNLAEDLKVGILSEDDIRSFEFIDSYLMSDVDGKKVPPPDFILLFGKSDQVSGFMPWQLRYSEIILSGSLEGMNSSRFWSHLEQYAHCSQRFGK